MSFQQNFPNINAALVDKQGNIQQNWLQFFRSLWNRTGAGTGSIVSNVSAIGEQGVITNVSDPSTTPNITIGLGNITPTSVLSSGPVIGSNLSGNNSGDVTIVGENYLGISGQSLIAHPVNLSNSNVTGQIGTISLADNSVTDAKLRQGIARSVIGVTGNATANEADIQGTANQVLRINSAGNALSFGLTLDNITVGGTTPAPGTFTVSTADRFIPIGATIPSNGMYLSAANQVGIAANSGLSLLISSVGTPVNYLNVTSTGSGLEFVQLTAAGSDTDISMEFASKGAGGFDFLANGDQQFGITRTASSVNYLNIAGSASTTPTMSASGSSTDIDIVLSPKGAGLLKMGNATSFTANGTVATVLTALGPVGAHTTVQKWLTIKDSGGTTYYIPAF